MITPLPEIEESIFDRISETTFTENENENGWIMPEPEDEELIKTEIMEYVEFNLNHNVKVKLSKEGYQRLAALHNSYLKIIPKWKKRTYLYFKNQADNEGYTTFQMWNFMEYFGNVTHMGMSCYFETSVLINIES